MDASTTRTLREFKEYLERIYHFERVNSLLFWDSIQRVPPKGAKGRAATKGAMAAETMRLQTSPEMKAFLDALQPHTAEMGDLDKALVRVASRAYKFYCNVPADLYAEHEAAKGEAIAIWETARPNNDWGALVPHIDTLIAQNKRLAECFGYENTPYDALLDYYEEGMSSAILDELFGQLKEAIVPLVQRIGKKQFPVPEFLHKPVPLPVQRSFNEELYRYMGLDPDMVMLTETTHPFSFNINLQDVRFSTRYTETDFASSLFSILHEGGHTINSLNIPDEVEGTILGGGTSAAFQESQSRFYENVIGRSRAFWEGLYDRFMAAYRPYIGDVTVDDLYRGFNRCEPSLIRTAADEVTYCLHILIRYEMERDFINGTVAAADLPAIWNKKIKDYLGLDVPSDTVGILQDIQWPYGRFGAFVSYAIGNCYNVQILREMEKEVDVFGSARKGDLLPINRWLGEHVHRYSQVYTPNELIRRVVGEGLNPRPYIDYLSEKMADVYGL